MAGVEVVFFDIGQTLVTGSEQSARRLLGARLELTEKETRRVGKLLMTLDCREPAPLASALREILPGRDPSRLREAVEAVWIEQISCVREVPGATALVGRLREMGLKVGVISNIWHPFYLGFRKRCPEMASFMDYVFLSYRVGCKKPALEFYRKAVQAVGQPAARCWMVGDTYELDMEPARQVGMRTLWVLCGPERERALLARVLRGEKPCPDWSVANLDEVLPFFEGALGD